jgi:simple sugar transport system ATP-binding protein
VNLLPNLSVAENIMLGREPRRWGSIDYRAMREQSRGVLDTLGIEVDPESMLGTHSLAIQQLISIARAIHIDAKVLILDEPTSSLDADEVAELFRIIRNLRDDGVAILFVSHFLDQVYEIADRLTVLRNGRLVGEYLTPELLRIELVQKMIGKEVGALEDLEQRVRENEQAAGAAVPFLRAKGIARKGAVAPVDLSIGEGEVVGFAGLLGSGRTEVARLLGGIDRSDAGTLEIRGDGIRLRTPRQALSKRIAFSSENRRAEGIVDELTVRDNIILALQADRGWFRPIPRKRRDELAQSYIDALHIRPANPDAIVRNLSGGNQQKVLLGRWLAVAPRLLILDEPTRGIDIGAKAEIQKLVISLAENGMSVVFISAELEEVLRLSHRIVVMRDRQMVADLDNDDLTIDNLLALIAEGDGDDDPGETA